MLLTLMVLEGIFWLNKLIAIKNDWENYFVRRFILQFTADSFYTLLIIIGIRLTISFAFFEKDFIKFSDEAIYLVVAIILVLLVNLSDMGWFLFSRWKTSIVEIEKYKKEKAEFHLGMLQAQLNPHFLFNSLNTLSSLIYESKDLAAEFTRELADVYRYVLDSRNKELVSLKEEKTFTDSFIKLYRIRFDKKLTINFNIAITNKLLVPPLIMQLLIENAVKHNIVSQNKPLTIDIFQKDNLIIVKNNLQEKRSTSYSTEVGLDNIINRYKYFTDNKVAISKTETEFIVEIPIISVDEQKN